ncbi:MAG: PA2169 family four-helix-bundle protein [Cyclobacteriaceae bacterium]|nr:PA2169 family four-helix-bundle protein [Cyclobacteriaceae bacterium]
MENQKTIDVLNSLIQINNDRMDGYDHASNETDESDLRDMFSVLSATSRKCNEELIEQVEELGGEPIEGTTASGKIYRVWMDVKAALTKKDRKAILDSCEYGEDWAVKTYENVLKDKTGDLTSELNQIVREQYQWIKKDHDKVRNMRDSVPA